MRLGAWWCAGLMALALAACDGAGPAPEASGPDCAAADLTPEQKIDACSAALDSGALDEPARADAFAERGTAKLEERQHTAALADFNAALAIDRNHALALLGKARILTASGQIDAAEPLVAQLLAAHEREAEAYFLRGEARAMQSDAAGAIEAYDAAISRAPRMAEAYAHRGRVKQRAEDFSGAAADYVTALSIDAHNADALAGRCWTRLQQGGDVEAARRDAAAAAAAEPGMLEAQVCLGLTHLRQERWSEARAAFEDAARIAPGDASALYGRGLARKRSGDRRPGDDDIDRAQELDSRVDRRFRAVGVRT
jgi:tetratricopeptide (TPR) repeat protein